MIYSADNQLTAVFHCVKSIRYQSFSGPFFLTFGVNTEIYRVMSIFSPNVEKYGPEKL